MASLLAMATAQRQQAYRQCTVRQTLAMALLKVRRFPRIYSWWTLPLWNESVNAYSIADPPQLPAKDGEAATT